MMMGVYGMIFGFLKLGFLLELVSTPIMTGFISAVAITIILNQMGSLLGTSIPSSAKAYDQIRLVFELLPEASGLTCAIGFSGIFFLTVLDHAGKRWSAKSKVIWLLSITRAFLALLVFTSISYAVNHGFASDDDYLFAVVKVKSQGQEAPAIPSGDLLSKVATPALTVFIGAAIEHTAIARAFGIKNNYAPDQSQELCYFGVINFFNSFFHSMGVGGAMSRTSVNSSCKVKSPLSGVFTTAVILVCIYFLVGTLYWIPKATLAAIIICAVWPLIYPPSAFYRFWKTSLADFITSMLAFWLSLFYSTEFGIFIPIAFNLIYNFARQTFTSVTASQAPAPTQLASELDAQRGLPYSAAALVADDMLRDVHIFRFEESLFFPNSYRLTQRVLDSVQTHHAPVYSGAHGPETERNWSVTAEKRLNRLRRAAGTDPSTLPPIGLVVLDMGRVNHLDTTAVTHLRNLVAEVKRYGGSGVVFRFVDVSPYVAQRLQRAGWSVLDARVAAGELEDLDTSKTTLMYGSVAEAVLAPRTREWEEIVLEKMGTEKSGKPHAEWREDV